MNIRKSAFYLERFRYVNHILVIFCLISFVTAIGYVIYLFIFSMKITTIYTLRLYLEKTIPDMKL